MSAREMSASAESAGSTTLIPATVKKVRPVKRAGAVLCVVFIASLIVVAAVAPMLLPDIASENAGDLASSGEGPSREHLLGTDMLGRDLLQRLLVGARPTLLGVAVALIVVLLLGLPTGLAAGYFGGRVDRVLGWFADLTFSMPAIILALVVLAVFPHNMTAGMATLGVIAAPALMRVVRAATLVVREDLYISAAKISGVPEYLILTRHVLPRISGAVVVQTSLLAAQALLAQTSLSFLGLIVKAPEPSWGGMTADGVKALVLHPWLIWPPGLVTALTILAFGLLGDFARDSIAGRSTTAPSGKASGAARRTRRTRSSLDVVPAVGDAASQEEPQGLLEIREMSVALDTDKGRFPVLQGVSFSVAAGETLGLVGESGCGKTMTAKAIMGLLPPAAHLEGGEIRFGGCDLANLDERAMRRIRGRRIAMIFQEPMISLNPSFQVGWQVEELVRRHLKLDRKEARRRTLELLESVHLPHPVKVARQYPHELSGGMAQRVSIARSLAGEPELLIADEPTTALDVTVQAQILELLREIQQSRNMGLLLVTHDWGVVADICDRAVVMYAGQVVEEADVESIFYDPRHPYTQGLLESDPHRVTESKTLPTIGGSVPGLGEVTEGCKFRGRCRLAMDACGEAGIPLVDLGEGRSSRCLLATEDRQEAASVTARSRSAGVGR